MLTRYGLRLGVLTISFFGLILLLAVLAAVVISWREARRQGQQPQVLLDVLFWALLAGLVVGRLVYVLAPPPSVAQIYSRAWYFSHLLDLQLGPLAVWSGGLNRAGIAVGVGLGALVSLRRRGCDLRAWADTLAPGMLAALAIAPWANVANEQLFGPPTRLPWGVALARRVIPYTDLTLYPPGTRFHPTPAYVSLWVLGAAVVWLALHRRLASRLRPGEAFLLAAGLTAPGFFLADFLRADVTRPLLGLSFLQWLSLLVLLAVAAWVVRGATGGGFSSRVPERSPRSLR